MNARSSPELVLQPSGILDRNALEQLVRALEVSKQALLTFEDPIMGVNPNGIVYFANRAARKLLNQSSSPDRLPYLLEQLVNPVLEGGRDHIPDDVGRRHLSSGGSSGGILLAIHPQGTRRKRDRLGGGDRHPS